MTHDEEKRALVYAGQLCFREFSDTDSRQVIRGAGEAYRNLRRMARLHDARRDVLEAAKVWEESYSDDFGHGIPQQFDLQEKLRALHALEAEIEKEAK